MAVTNGRVTITRRSREILRRTQVLRRGVGATVFLNAPERFLSVDDWLQYGRALPTERPRDLWLRVRECLVREGTTASIDGWLVHVLRVYEPGIPGRLSQLGLVRADAGVAPEMLESSTAAIAKGLALE